HINAERYPLVQKRQADSADIKHHGKLTFDVAPNRHGKHGFAAVGGHDGLLQPMVTNRRHRDDDAIAGNGSASKWVSSIHLMTKGIRDSQNSRNRFAQSTFPSTRVAACSM